MPNSRLSWSLVIPGIALAFAGAGAVRWVAHDARGAGRLWLAGLILTGAPMLWRTGARMMRGSFATDVVAAMAIIASVLQNQPLPGLVVVLMQSGGEALERYAEGRASAAVRALEHDAPLQAHRLRAGSDALTEDVNVGEVMIGDRLLVRPGEMVPCDAVVLHGSSHVDTARLTGEPVPLKAAPGVRLLSGMINMDGAVIVSAVASAGESHYARIVELVRSAQASKAPLQRLAERYAVCFTPATLAVCAVKWLLSHDAERVLAVLVVATPCPLILATPVAIVGGVNKAARRLIVVRHGGALEQIAAVTTAVFDKTGTLTVGKPDVSRVVACDGTSERDILRLAASLEERSGHLLARSVVSAAVRAGVPLSTPLWVRESPGRGIEGRVDEHTVRVGSRGFVDELHAGTDAGSARTANDDTGLRAWVTVDGRRAGAIEFADRVRPGLARVFRDLRRWGIGRTILLSGDSAAHSASVAAAVGIEDARGELLPGDKVAVVRELVQGGERVLMVGDGTNDAPALSAATVGVALAGHGGGITAEAADVVILGDDVSGVVDAIRIGRRTLRIARQSIWVGLGLSGVAMIFAAAGHIPPIAGALLQEGVDVALIVNALRASR